MARAPGQIYFMNNVHFQSKTYEWETPRELFDLLDREFHFTLDPCATPQNTKCRKFWTIKQNGLCKNWDGEVIFMNPPYGREIGKWVAKISEHGGVALLPAR